MANNSKFVGSIDQGTSSTRFCILNHAGQLVAQHQMEHKQYYPQNGWVEHDPEEIWNNTQACIAGALVKAKLKASDLCAIGVTNQRETTVVWDAATGKPLHKAIVWNCTRTSQLAATFVTKLGGQEALRPKTGLPIVSYFSALKLVWLFENVKGLKAKATAGTALFGTIDSWLIWNLSGGTTHVTDVTNASRTLLFNLKTLDWDEELLKIFGVPRGCLPTIKTSSEVYCAISEKACDGKMAGVPVAGILGDQHAALFGQGCFSSGQAKATYGTGCFIMMNTGGAPTPSKSGLLTTVGYQLKGQPAVYALEGAVSVCGSLVQWIRDQLELIGDASETEALATACGAGGSEGLVFVPAFAGLFAPHWREDARGTICGLTAFHGKRHLVRACLEAAAFQAHEVLEAMELDSGVKLAALNVDGGMTANELMLQFQSDIANTPVNRPAILETTAVGAAYAAGLAVGFWKDISELSQKWQLDKQWKPAMIAAKRAVLAARWKKAVAKSMGWVESSSSSPPTAGTKTPLGWLPFFLVGALCATVVLKATNWP